jgi:hypothetical protein
MGCEHKNSRSWLLSESMLVSWEILRFSQDDKPEEMYTGLTTAGEWGLLRVGRCVGTESLSMEALCGA